MAVKVNQDILQGKWKQLKGKVQQQWGKLTNDEIDKMQGRTEELVGLLQERYGYSIARAQQEVDDFIHRTERESKFHKTD